MSCMHHVLPTRTPNQSLLLLRILGFGILFCSETAAIVIFIFIPLALLPVQCNVF